METNNASQLKQEKTKEWDNITVCVPKGEKKGLRIMAAQDNRSLSGFIMNAVSCYLKMKEQEEATR
jgi:hypothetical protein